MTIVIIIYFDRGDFVLDGEKVEDGIIFDYKNNIEKENRKKKININALFGPHKASGIHHHCHNHNHHYEHHHYLILSIGIIFKKQNYFQRKFSHKRIFGHKTKTSIDTDN